jgi:hypothetical protein
MSDVSPTGITRVFVSLPGQFHSCFSYSYGIIVPSSIGKQMGISFVTKGNTFPHLLPDAKKNIFKDSNIKTLPPYASRAFVNVIKKYNRNLPKKGIIRR